MKQRTRPRFNLADPAEVRRLARWYDGIGDDYAAAIATTYEGPTIALLRTAERDARRRAAQLRAQVAHLDEESR